MKFPTMDEMAKDVARRAVEEIEYNGKTLSEWIDIIAKYQEVNLDCVSRQQAIDALRTCYDTEMVTMDNGDEYINYGDAVGGIEQLPSLEPIIGRIRWERDVAISQLKELGYGFGEKPKKGKWIEYEQEFMSEEPLKMVQKTVRECSVCTAKIAGMVGIMNYCPNCGADMREKQNG